MTAKEQPKKPAHFNDFKRLLKNLAQVSKDAVADSPKPKQRKKK